MMVSVGIDLGGTKVKGALIRDDGKILCEHYERLHGRGGTEVCDLIIQTVRKLSQEVAANEKLSGVGICIPGIAGPFRKTVWAPNIPGWDELPLVEILKKDALLADLPVYADSDRACCLRGEIMYGNASGTTNAVFVTVGTGIGAGIMVDGHVLSGYGAISGATGWMALERPYKEKFIPMGCFEYYASGDGLTRSAREYLNDNPSYSGKFAGRVTPVTSEEIFSAYNEKDDLSIFVIHQAVELWGMAVANYVSLLNPEIIIFGGGVFGPATVFLPEIKKEAERWAQPIAIKQVKLVSSALGGNAALYGAAALASNKT